MVAGNGTSWTGLPAASTASLTSAATCLEPRMSVRVCSPSSPQQRVAVAEQVLDAELRAGLAQEVVLAGGADEVVVAVAVAHVVERVGAAQALVAGLRCRSTRSWWRRCRRCG